MLSELSELVRSVESQNVDQVFEAVPTLASSAIANGGTMQSFSNPVSLKLKHDNYLPLKQEALATIKGC